MKNILNIIIENALIGNILHIIIALLYVSNNNESKIISVLFLIMLLMIWVVTGFRFAARSKSIKDIYIFVFAGVSLAPMGIILIAAQLAQGLAAQSVGGVYSLFYFIGSPIILWNKPLEAFTKLFKESNIYVQLDINIVLIFFAVFIGSYMGMQLRRNKKIK